MYSCIYLLVLSFIVFLVQTTCKGVKYYILVIIIYNIAVPVSKRRTRTLSAGITLSTLNGVHGSLISRDAASDDDG